MRRVRLLFYCPEEGMVNIALLVAKKIIALQDHLDFFQFKSKKDPYIHLFFLSSHEEMHF